jgi:hypothetical protein
MQRQTCYNKEIQHNIKWKKLSSPNFYTLYHMKKVYIREKKKKSRGTKKILIWGKEKKNQIFWKAFFKWKINIL